VEDVEQQFPPAENGAGDEDTRSDSEGDGGQAEVVGGSRDHRGNGPDDAPLARAVQRTRLQRFYGITGTATEPEARAGGGSGKVLQLYREKYFDFNVQHFHEKLPEEHGLHYSYTWVKAA
jgi:hypothetical protein